MDFEGRIESVRKFYELLNRLERIVGGKRNLADAHGRLDWPARGVYFFFEPGEDRDKSGEGDRVVRVGTHALKAGASTTLWKRLSQHQGVQRSGGGNHRGSVFRLHVGNALIAQDNIARPGSETWGTGSSAQKEIREREKSIELAVSNHVRRMPFLWLTINDLPGPDSLRGYIERNTIALLSNFGNSDPIDRPSSNWLGSWAKHEKIRTSGLWNVKHVDEQPEQEFLAVLESLIQSPPIQT